LYPCWDATILAERTTSSQSNSYLNSVIAMLVLDVVVLIGTGNVCNCCSVIQCMQHLYALMWFCDFCPSTVTLVVIWELLTCHQDLFSSWW